MAGFALAGADVFDGEDQLSGYAVVVKEGFVETVCPEAELPPGLEKRLLRGGLLAPGFVDIQVNGGGGTLFNDEPSVEGVRHICAAHARFGSTALLPTVITDQPAVTLAAIEAVEEALAEGVPGCLGIHVEGPFIAPARKGAHDPALIRRMGKEDLRRLCETKVRPLLLTLAPENVDNAQIAALNAAGIRVSIGHSEADFETAISAFDAGATCVTHLFNAMSQMNHRAPGLVGAALARRDIWCGVIPDGHHVHPSVLQIAVQAKQGTRKLMAVTDAMPTVGSKSDTFELNGRIVTRRNGKLTLPDGTLAGSNLNMIDALRYIVSVLHVPLSEALRMCAVHPAAFLGCDAMYGRLQPKSRADIIWIDPVTLEHQGVWISGKLIKLEPHL